MDLVQIDVIGAETAQAGVHGSADVIRFGASSPLLSDDGAGELGGDQHLIAAAAQRFTELLLAGAVGIGCVEEVDAFIQGGIDDGRHRLGRHPEAEVVGAQADERDLE